MGFFASIELSIYCLPPKTVKTRRNKKTKNDFLKKPVVLANIILATIATKTRPTTGIPVYFVPRSMPAAINANKAS